MNQNLSTLQRVEQLATQQLLSDITSSEIAELEQLVLADEDARRAYVMFIRDAVQLHWIEQAVNDHPLAAVGAQPPASSQHENRTSSAEEIPIQPSATAALVLPPRSWDRALWRHRFGVGIAAGLLFCAALIGWAAMTYLPGVAQERPPQQEVAEVEWIARLNHAHEAKWLDGTKPAPHHPRLLPGQRLAISAGVLEINYRTGARVIVEGPADFVVGGERKEKGERRKEKANDVYPLAFSLSPLNNSGYLAVGKLVARCETAESKGFTVATPAGSVVDLGTEFGVSVDAAGTHEVEVVRGVVDVLASNGARRVRLTASQAVRFDGNSPTNLIATSIEASPRAFAKKLLAHQFPQTVQLALADAVSVTREGTPTTPKTAAALKFFPNATKYVIRECAPNTTRSAKEVNRQRFRTRLFLKFDVSRLSGKIDYASLNLQVAVHLPNAGETPIHVARVTQPWDTASGENYPLFGQEFADRIKTPIDDDTPRGKGVVVDITQYVQQWIDGTHPNHGLVLFFSGREFVGQSYVATGGKAPHLSVTLAAESTANESNEGHVPD